MKSMMSICYAMTLSKVMLIMGLIGESPTVLLNVVIIGFNFILICEVAAP